MDAYLRQLFSYLFDNNNTSEEKIGLICEILSLLNQIISSYVSVISENVANNLIMIDKNEYSFVVQRENMIPSLYSS